MEFFLRNIYNIDEKKIFLGYDSKIKKIFRHEWNKAIMLMLGKTVIENRSFFYCNLLDATFIQHLMI